MRSNYKSNSTIQFKTLSREQCDILHYATLEVLSDTGVIVQEKRSLELLKKSGAFVNGNQVRIPPALVEKAISTTPSSVALYDRKGNRKMRLEGENFYFGPGPSTTYTIDPYTGERRYPKKQDTRNAAKIIDALPNIDFAMDFGTIKDVPTEIADIHLLHALLENTTKPIIHWGFNAKNLETIVDICLAVAGDLEELQKYPFISLFSTSNTPLQHSEEAIEKLVFTAEKNLPAIYVSAPMAGGTSPVTLAGTVIVALAECLSGLVIHQLVREGAPFVMGGVPAPTDMNTMVMSYGNPEFNLMHAAFAEMAHYYKIPMWGTAGCSDSKALDEQSAIEATASIMMSAMSGANLIHDVGYLEGGTTSSVGQLVMCDEIIGFVKRMIRGVEVNDVTLALEVIKKVGPAGHFVTDEHTFNNFKRELWIPKILDKNQYQVWCDKGKITCGQRAMEKARYIIENHISEPLPEKAKVKIDAILDRL